ncbi:hypothetical protein OYC64_022107, partial [Pagothenia borchgrevinki]
MWLYHFLLGTDL